jgi:hypothetical protein
MATANTQQGKPVQVNDFVTLAPGQVTVVSGSGVTASVTVKFNSGATVVVLGSDIASGAQTL